MNTIQQRHTASTSMHLARGPVRSPGARSLGRLIMMASFLCALGAFAQLAAAQSEPQQVVKETEEAPTYRVSLPVIILPQLVEKSWDDPIHTQHFELHIKRDLDDKNIVGLKFATWRLFQPMGILWWDGLLDSIDSGKEFYPGHVRESGIGVTYQRMLWEGLFASVEVLPQLKTYLDKDGSAIQHGFKLYTSVHLGYHLALGNFFIEPQVHSQFWILDTNTPKAFKAHDDKWRDYFLFEPNLYAGVKW